MRRDSTASQRRRALERGSTPPVVRGPAQALVVTAVCCMIAVLLRVLHLGHGLPDLTEEAFPFRHALRLWGATGERIDLNPHWFAYPSLTVYLQFLVQELVFRAGQFATPADFLLTLARDPSPAVIAGRWVAVLADVLTIVSVGRISRRFGELPAALAMALVALSPTLIQTSRLLSADSVMCACSVAAVERMLTYEERGGVSRLLVAACFAGLAIGAKYPAAVLLVPLAVVAWSRERRPVRCAQALALAGLVFLCTTPYLLVSGSEFVRDLVYMSDTSTRGGLGRIRGSGLLYYLALLAHNLGWLGAALLGLSAGDAAHRRAGGMTGLLWLCWAVLLLPVAGIPVEADRYLVPTLAISSCIVAAGASLVLQRLRSLRPGLAGASMIAIVLLQPALAGVVSAIAGASTTQREARLWCEARLGDSDLLLSEAYGPYLLSHGRRAQVITSPLFQAAGQEAKASYASQRAYHAVSLPLLIGGYASVRMPTPQAEEWDVYPHAVDWNAAVYDLRLLKGVDYVVTTGAVRGRFEADRTRFAAQARFYARLDSLAEAVAVFDSSPRIEGPSVRVYRMTARARASIAEAGSLDPLWWARPVPARFRAAADSLLAAKLPLSERVPGLPLWVHPLRESYRQRYGPFAFDLAQHLAALGRASVAENLLVSSLTVVPEDIESAMLYSVVGGSLGRWGDVGRVLERSCFMLARYGPVSEDLRLRRAEALVRAGAGAEAKRIAEELSASSDPSVVRAASELLTQIGAER